MTFGVGLTDGFGIAAVDPAGAGDAPGFAFEAGVGAGVTVGDASGSWATATVASKKKARHRRMNRLVLVIVKECR
jgi:hypothetical protein